MTQNNQNTDSLLLESCEYEALPILQGALRMYFSKLFSFLTTSLFLVIGFLLIAFALVYNYGEVDLMSFFEFTKNKKLFSNLSLDSKQAIGLVVLFWIFFSWLRMSYLVAANGFFGKTNPIVTGFSKVISFILIDLMRFIILLLGTIILPMLPFIVVKYYISSAVLSMQNEGAINSMLESGEYVEGRMMATIRCSMFITILTLIGILSTYVISDFFIKDNLIFWSVNLLFFIFIFLPINACYRVLVFRKLQFLDGELRVQETTFEKFWFVFFRIFLLASAVAMLFVVINGQLDGFLANILFGK